MRVFFGDSNKLFFNKHMQILSFSDSAMLKNTRNLCDDIYLSAGSDAFTKIIMKMLLFLIHFTEFK